MIKFFSSGHFKIMIFLLVFALIELSDQPFEKKLDLDIVYIGNSITQGAQLGNPEEDAPPATASEYLRRRSGVGIVKFLNRGKSGYTTVDYLPSDTGALQDRNRQLVFTISLGTNDSAEKGPDGSPVEPADYQKNLKSIADHLLSVFPACKIIFLQPIWYSPNTYNSSKYMAEGLARLQSYFPELQSLVLKYAHVLPGRIFLGDLKGFAYFRNNYLTDLIPESGNAGTFYLHPNKKGATVLGRLWGEAIYQSLFRQFRQATPSV
jgi:lysophospholipase L1-like esterase